MKKEEMVKAAKDAHDIIEEAFGPLGDSMVKASSIAMLVSKLDITDLDDNRPGPLNVGRRIAFNPARLRPLPPGCPFIDDLRWKDGSKIWVATCNVVKESCADVLMCLSNHHQCVTYHAQKYIEARESDAESNDRS